MPLLRAVTHHLQSRGSSLLVIWVKEIYSSKCCPDPRCLRPASARWRRKYQRWHEVRRASENGEDQPNDQEEEDDEQEGDEDDAGEVEEDQEAQHPDNVLPPARWARDG